MVDQLTDCRSGGRCRDSERDTETHTQLFSPTMIVFPSISCVFLYLSPCVGGLPLTSRSTSLLSSFLPLTLRGRSSGCCGQEIRET
jgi:hypothetical protein